MNKRKKKYLFLMLISLLIFLLFSNAVIIRRDKSILFSRVEIMSLLLISFIAYSNIYIKPLGNGIGIYGGLFNLSVFTQTFNIFILLVSAIILTLTAFYPSALTYKYLICLFISIDLVYTVYGYYPISLYE